MIFKELLFNRTLFIGFLCAFTLGVIVLLICLQFNPQIKPKANDLILYPLDKQPVNFPMVLNYDKSFFTKEQETIIKNSAIVWNKQSNGIVDIKVNSEWIAPVPFSRNAYEFFGKKTIWVIKEDNPEITKLQLQTSINADGIAIGDFIVIIKTNNITNKKLSIIALHEIGHMIGLEHIKEQYPALMNLNGNDGIFTEYDLITLCSKYNCK